jgi:hypothetical protein
MGPYVGSPGPNPGQAALIRFGIRAQQRIAAPPVPVRTETLGNKMGPLPKYLTFGVFRTTSTRENKDLRVLE